MIRNYSNEKIYRNFKVVNILSTISIFLAIIGAIIDVSLILSLSYDFDLEKLISYHVCSLFIPIAQYLSAHNPHKQRFIKETKFTNDFSNLLTIILVSLLPLVCYIVFSLVGAFIHIYIPHILIYIADGFLIHNCVLIKREWKDSPPEFYKEKLLKITQKRSDLNIEVYNSLIEQCGIKFFIKYYKQVKRLPLRDVSVTENYSSSERDERLIAVKKIIDLNLTELALSEILKTYSDILDEEEVAQSKSLLSELQTSKTEYTESVTTAKQPPKPTTEPLYDDWDD